MTWWVFLFALGATARITRFGVSDVLFQPTRSWLARRQGEHQIGLATVFHCDWCLSVWVAAVVYGWAYLADGADWFAWPAAALTASYVYSLVAQTFDGEDD